MTATIVSAGDSGYFHLLKGLVLSILEHRPDRAISISVIDVGLEPAQVEELKSLGVAVAAGEWDFEFAGRDTRPRWFQAMTARCHLPKYFPGHEIYIWLDADLWLADWRAVELVLKAATGGSVAVVPEIHRAYRHIYQLGTPNADGLLDLYAQSLGIQAAKPLAMVPVLNSGVLGIRADSKLWSAWNKWMRVALKGQVHKLTEQCALNAAVYFEHIGVHPLPAWCNWVCGQALPAYDAENRRFVEPVLPNDVISILHPTPRELKVAKLKTLEGREVEMAMDYLEFKGSLKM